MMIIYTSKIREVKRKQSSDGPLPVVVEKYIYKIFQKRQFLGYYDEQSPTPFVNLPANNTLPNLKNESFISIKKVQYHQVCS